jgi:hypothetical protein
MSSDQARFYLAEWKQLSQEQQLLVLKALDKGRHDFDQDHAYRQVFAVATYLLASLAELDVLDLDKPGC